MRQYGYDIDGTLFSDVNLRPNPEDIIITGRSFESAPETYSALHKKGIFNAVYFNPNKFEDVTIENSALWKSTIIDATFITRFYEDDERQINLINRYSRRVRENSCIIIQVG